MKMKFFAGALAVALFLIYNGAIAWKLKDVSLIIVILIGFTMMAVDLYQSLKGKDD